MAILSTNASKILGILSVFGRQSAAELMRRTKLSQATVSRALVELRVNFPNFLSCKDGRGVIYALKSNSRSLLDIPVVRVSEKDVPYAPVAAGFVSAISGGGFAFEHIGGTVRFTDSLPWFLQDARYQGYIGRSFCHGKSGEMGLSKNLNGWTDEDALHALRQYGTDLPGNLVVGVAASDNSRLNLEQTNPSDRTQYDTLATRSVSGSIPGSSAAGEHPKFISGNCIVKFSPVISGADGAKVAERWSDLLIAEHCATVILNQNDIDAPVTRIIQTSQRTYLESVRYDRIGSFGRRGVVSIGTVDDEFVGSRRNWSDTADRLVRQGRLTGNDAEKIAVTEQFGRLIGNTDMHFGNLSFYLTAIDGELSDDCQFSLAPIYDMLPMHYAPEKSEIVERGRIEIDDMQNIQNTSKAMALEFWAMLSEHERVSKSFSEIARENARQLTMMRLRP